MKGRPAFSTTWLWFLLIGPLLSCASLVEAPAAPELSSEPPASSETNPQTSSGPEPQTTSEAEPQKKVRKWTYDEENAREILETCAGCHGRDGRGGKEGTYPRLAGLNERYLARQLRAFKARTRINIPMFPYATERELSRDDVRDISRFFSRIELPTKMPVLAPDAGALERLLAAQSVFNVARVDGDVERGGQIYEDECSECHGAEGAGHRKGPRLAGQYTRYLRRQIAAFRSGERANEEMEEVLSLVDGDDLEDVFAYLAALDD